jgi:uncharacterized damage-inducible protein DinB
MTLMSKARFLRCLKKTPVILDAILKDLSPEQVKQLRDGEGGWNVVEVMCHLRDFENIFFRRAQQIVDEDRPTIVPVDHEALAAAGDYAIQDLKTVYGQYLDTRRRFITWLEGLADDEWHCVGIHPESGEMTVMEIAMQVTTHDVDHTEQIIRILGLADAQF